MDPEPWQQMVAEAQRHYPEECCGVLLGIEEGGLRRVTRALPFQNASTGPHTTTYEIRVEDLLAASREASDQGLKLLGVYHSHPDRDAYFSPSDAERACPWYSYVVLSVRQGVFDHARSYLGGQEEPLSISRSN